MDNEEGVTLEQGLECVLIFIDKYYYQKNKNILLIEVFKNQDLILKNKDTLKDNNIWKAWLNCFEEARRIDGY